MLFLTALISAFAFVLISKNAMKKYPAIFYIAAAVLSAGAAAATWFNFRVTSEFLTFLMGLFARGTFATALWCIVMWSGALPNGSWLLKKFMPIRGELSITAAILTFGHNIGYGKTYFNMLFTNVQRMDLHQFTASILTIAMLIIIIPLTVMSFPKIRRKMKPKLWKNIQRTAYLFYAMLYVHVMLLTFPLARRGRSGYLFSVGIYSVVFIGYLYFRIRKCVIRKCSEKGRIIMNGTAVLPVSAMILIMIAGQPQKPDTLQNNEICITVTETTITSTKLSDVSENVTETYFSDVSVTTAVSLQTTEPIETSYHEDEELADDESSEESEEIEAPPAEDEPQPEPEPEPQYVYNNGEFSASAYGYDGEIFVTVTIQDDVIMSITGYSDESDTWYYDNAASQVIPDIIASQNISVDAYSGATYSSEAIKSAVRSAIENARK